MPPVKFLPPRSEPAGHGLAASGDDEGGEGGGAEGGDGGGAAARVSVTVWGRELPVVARTRGEEGGGSR